MGCDGAGNRYYENRVDYPFGQHRWVEPGDIHNFDSASIPPEWHGWMTSMNDAPPPLARTHTLKIGRRILYHCVKVMPILIIMLDIKRKSIIFIIYTIWVRYVLVDGILVTRLWDYHPVPRIRIILSRVVPIMMHRSVPELILEIWVEVGCIRVRSGLIDWEHRKRRLRWRRQRWRLHRRLLPMRRLQRRGGRLPWRQEELVLLLVHE